MTKTSRDLLKVIDDLLVENEQLKGRVEELQKALDDMFD